MLSKEVIELRNKEAEFNDVLAKKMLQQVEIDLLEKDRDKLKAISDDMTTRSVM